MDPVVLCALLKRLESSPEIKRSLLEQSEHDSEVVQQQVQSLYDSLVSHFSNVPVSIARSGPVRVYMASCMDIIHSGHFNCMRQAKALGDILVMGVIADDEIRRCKGPPVMNQEERAAMIRACRWVDEVIVGVEYYVNCSILERVRCDFVAHGDDIPIRKDTGTDAYEEVRSAGMLKIVRRTEGISTTDLVGKMLLMTQDSYSVESSRKASDISQGPPERQLLAVTRRIKQFAGGRSATSEDRVVYIDGAYDLIHAGHVETLKKASELGTYLIVGVHDDKVVNNRKGKNFPIMNLYERTLNLLAIRYVDDVIMGAPWEITEDMIKSLNVSVVVSGSRIKSLDGPDPYSLPKSLGIFHEVESESSLNTEQIVDRILTNRRQYIDRNKRAEANLESYYQTRTHMQEL